MCSHPSHASTPSTGAVCPWWLCPAFDNPLRRLIQNPNAILRGLLRPGDIALDLGCGMGYFSIPLARLVGPSGKVICVDLQEPMLAAVRRRAERAGVAERIELHQVQPGSLELHDPADFALAFWMLHEVPDQAAFLAEVREALTPLGRLLLVEPRLHVGGDAFERSVATACRLGFVPMARPRVRISRAVLFGTKSSV